MNSATFAEVVRLVDTLTTDEKNALRDHLNHEMNGTSTVSAAERIAAFNRAVDAVREGLTDAQLDELEWAMNHEYVADAEDLE